MSYGVTDTQNYENIANAIIEKGGASAPMKPAEMADHIKNISTGASIDDYAVSVDTTYSSYKINTELDKKVDRIDGKGLSSNDFTTAEKEKLASLENFSLTPATASNLGGVKVGKNLTVEADGTLNAEEGGVTSFNSRKGDVLPQAGDYTAEMVGADVAGTAENLVNNAKSLVVTITKTGLGTYQADATEAEIEAAERAGRLVIAKYDEAMKNKFINEGKLEQSKAIVGHPPIV